MIIIRKIVDFYLIAAIILNLQPFSLGYTYEGYGCSGVTSYLGVNSPSSYTSGIHTAQTGRLYIVEDSKYMSFCCGIITSWQFYARSTGTLELLVWRKVTETHWMITGKNRVIVTSTGLKSYDPSSSTLGDYRLSLQPGDYIGWYSLGEDIISYGSSSSKLSRVRWDVHSVTVGDITDWALYDGDSADRDYAIKAFVTDGSSPSISSAGTITMMDSVPAGTVIHTVTINNADLNDDIFVSLKNSDSSYFAFDTSSYEISPKYSYIPENSYSLTIEVKDPCGNKHSVAFTVQVTNEPVKINNVPTGTSETIAEATLSQTRLHEVITTDTSIEDFTYCYLGNPNVGPFVVEQNDVSVQTYDINVQDYPRFDYDVTSEYLLTIKCEDGVDTATSTFTVNIERDNVPYFTNNIWTTQVDAETAGIGTSIFQLTAADDEGDNIYFSIKCTPSNCPFVLLDSGVIVTSDVLIHDYEAEYSLAVTVTDGRRTSTESYVAVKINKINAKPVFGYIPTRLTVTENSPLGSAMYKFTASDGNLDDTLHMSIYFNHKEASSRFTFQASDGVLTTSTWNSIDYEELASKSYTATVFVGDGKFFKSQTLTVTVQNQNEAPFFLQKYYSAYQYEGATQTALSLPVYNYVEPDGDAVTFTFNCGANSGRFIMNSATGELRYNQEFDLDASTTVPTEIDCTVTITDPDGLSDTAVLAINIDHSNEHDPMFTAHFFYFYVDSKEFIGEIIGQVYASESDGSNTDHGIFYYTLDQTNLAKEYFGIMNNGKIYVKQSLTDLYLGQILVFHVTATDYAGRNQTIPVTVEVPAFITPLMITVDQYLLDYVTSPKNMPVLIIGCALAGIFGLMSMWFLVKYCQCPSALNACRKPPESESLLKNAETSPDTKPKTKPQDRKTLDEMFGIVTPNTPNTAATDF